MATVSNNWNERIRKGAKDAMREERKGYGSIAKYMAKEVAPYIGMRVAENAMAWRADSDECIKDVTRDLLEAAEVASIKGMSDDDAAETRNMQGFIRRAVNLYRACTLLAEKHGVSMQIVDNNVTFPVAWFVPDGRIRIVRSKSPVMLPMSGREKMIMKLETETDDDERYAFTISEASIIAASRPKTKRDASQTETSNGANAATLVEALPLVSSMMAAADYNVSGEAFDTFESIIEAYAAASPSNLAVLAGIVQKLQALQPDADSVAA